MSLTARAQRVSELLQQSQRLVVVTGAGVSTDSGIPDYRSPGRPPHRPTQHSEFMSKERARVRYWARSMIGYDTVFRAKPNAAHEALAKFEHTGKLHRLITQNVDDLHQRAGSLRVTSLHGSMNVVRCMSCPIQFSRAMMQDALVSLNRELYDEGLRDYHVQEVRPDGDINLDASVYDRFRVPPCWSCGGLLKPAVVFFGDSLMPEISANATRAIEEADAVLAIGSSLAVFSAFRLVRLALDRLGPSKVAVLNRGPTRADPVLDPDLRLEAAISPLLAGLLEGRAV